ncbi:MAG: arginine--tRNA ligase [Oscillospiraceae bacterium]
MDYGKKKELEKIDRNLKTYRVTMQSWMHETFFYEDNCKRINACLDRMADMGLTYEKDGALWFKSTDYGDEKDRVLRKSDGTFSYLTPDIANHVYKVERGYPLLVDLWGADHHSYVIRMQNALTALGYPKGTLEVDLIQMVRIRSRTVRKSRCPSVPATPSPCASCARISAWTLRAGSSSPRTWRPTWISTSSLPAPRTTTTPFTTRSTLTPVCAPSSEIPRSPSSRASMFMSA